MACTPRATLPTDRCHLNDAAVRINRHHRDDTAIGEEYMVERTISVHEDLPALAANLFKLRHKPLEIAGWQGEQKPIAGPIRWGSAPGCGTGAPPRPEPSRLRCKASEDPGKVPLAGVFGFVRRGGDVCSCAGFRTPECRDYPRVLTAGVRKAPRHEIAVGSAPVVRRALWGFGGGAGLE